MSSKYLTAALIAYATFVTPALAVNPFTSGKTGGEWPYGQIDVTDPYPAGVQEQITRNEEHRRETWERVRDSGGCNADVIPFEIASYCDKDAFGNGMHGSD